VGRRKGPVRVGVISDTHGLVRPEALRALRGVELIIHAGDVGKGDVVDRLRAIAPTVAVRGNNDVGRWATGLPPCATVRVGGLRVHVLHEIAHLDVDPLAAGIAAVVSGHSHRPSIERRDGVLYLNPGSAGPRRFTLPVSVARLSVSGDRIRARIVQLHC
jgi:uncharacterized protein